MTLCLAAAAAHAQKAPGFDLGALNRSVDPCANFYQYACGGWMTANPLPGDASRWGRFDALQDRNRMLLKEVLEAAAVDRPNRSATDQKIGDFYAACMDEKNLDARGLEAIQRDLNRIAVIQDRKEIADMVVYMFRSDPGRSFASAPSRTPRTRRG